MNDVSFDIACPQPARKPEAVATSLIGNHDALDLTPSLGGFIAPTMQKPQQPFLVGIKLLQGVAFNPGNQRRYEPLRLAHLDHGDDRAILLQGGEGPARFKLKMLLRHGRAPSVAVEQRRRGHALAALPIASAQLRNSCGSSSSLRLEAGRLDNRPPFLDFSSLKGAKCFRGLLIS